MNKTITFLKILTKNIHHFHHYLFMTHTRTQSSYYHAFIPSEKKKKIVSGFFRVFARYNRLIIA